MSYSDPWRHCGASALKDIFPEFGSDSDTADCRRCSKWFFFILHYQVESKCWASTQMRITGQQMSWGCLLCAALHTQAAGRKVKKKQPSPGRWRKLSQQLHLCSLFHLWVFHFILFFAFSVLCCWIYSMCLLGEFKEGTTERARISGVDMKAKWWEEVGGSLRGSGKYLLPGFRT